MADSAATNARAEEERAAALASPVTPSLRALVRS
jgi:hypothetical protein